MRLRSIGALRTLLGGGQCDVDSDNIGDLAALARTSEVAILAADAAPALVPLLGDALARQRQIDALLELALARAATALAKVGLDTRVALLKGGVTARTVYPTTAHRFRRDLDLLVPDGPEVDIVDIRAALLAVGFADDPGPDRGTLGPRAVRAWPMVLRPFGPTGLILSLDLHRRLVEVPWCRPDLPAMLAAARKDGAPLPLTSPADTLVHTAIHLAENGFRLPLKAWVDVARLVPTVTPAALAERARHHGARAASYAATRVASRWFTCDAAAHLAALAPPRAQRLALDLALAGDGIHPHRLALGPARRLFRALVADDARAAVISVGSALRVPGGWRSIARFARGG
jgi:hypothetical protein